MQFAINVYVIYHLFVAVTVRLDDMKCLNVKGYSGESSILASTPFKHTFRQLLNTHTLTVALTCGRVFIKRPGAFELPSSFGKGAGGFYEHKTGC